MGFLAVCFLPERSNREEGTQESNWLSRLASPAAYLQTLLSPTKIDAGRRNVLSGARGYLIKDNDRERTNAQATYQLMFSDSVTATVDYTCPWTSRLKEPRSDLGWVAGPPRQRPSRLAVPTPILLSAVAVRSFCNLGRT